MPEQDKLIRACKATLLFHRGGAWTPEVRVEWQLLTNKAEATTKSLCDFIREVLDEQE